MNDPQIKLHYRPDEIAEEFHVPLRTVHYWIKIGAIKHVHLGKHVRVSVDEMSRLRNEGIIPSVASTGTN